MYAYDPSNINVALRVEDPSEESGVSCRIFRTYNGVHFISLSWYFKLKACQAWELFIKTDDYNHLDTPNGCDPKLKHPCGEGTEDRGGRLVQLEAFHHNQQQQKEGVWGLPE